MIKILAILILVLSVVVHEVAHGLTAYLMGDKTAQKLGRLSFNPIRHIDPVLTLVLPLFLYLAGSPILFGGAKPVPVNPYFFRFPRLQMAVVALAGPLSNFLLALLVILSLKFLVVPFADSNLDSPLYLILLAIGFQAIAVNLVLGFFNLLPLLPLDGGRIVNGFLPNNLSLLYSQLEPFGIILVFLLLLSGALDPLFNNVFHLIEWSYRFAIGSQVDLFG
ncbi:MAG TPA: site-2 protease family protein [Oligoflexia bacterium]|nr:site-2 protease family protein [Oligoflexia bacterium]HMP27519.1 site-2 protease family protein [Oligoflexia bacterium]